jgi:hypothetical protein
LRTPWLGLEDIFHLIFTPSIRKDPLKRKSIAPRTSKRYYEMRSFLFFQAYGLPEGKKKGPGDGREELPSKMMMGDLKS